MTIFDYISNILFTKKKFLSNNIDSENDFSPYLVNRWISMYSEKSAKEANILNQFLGCLNKEELLILAHNLFTKMPSKKITYFKRKKEEEKKDNEIIKKVACVRELSVREITNYFNMLNYNKE